ncbi:MAG: TfoX/Sxy family protein [Candidatus Berkiella sp.]
MATSASTIEYILEQIAQAGKVSARKMFGEYAIYCNGKVVALACDDTLFVKPTLGGKKFIGKVIEAPPYEGAKPYYQISGEKWDDADWLSELIRISTNELPEPKPKKKKK